MVPAGGVSAACCFFLAGARFARRAWRLRGCRGGRRAGRAGRKVHPAVGAAEPAVQHGVGAPVDYYGLLGLPRFAASPEEIRQAHRRMAKLIHPDILGTEASALMELVNAACRTLSDQALRQGYDAALREGAGLRRTPAKAAGYHNSVWAAGTPVNCKPVFVDQTQCVMCNVCADAAPATFEMDVAGNGRARAFQQHGDTAEDIHWAIQGCPTGAISYVSKEDLHDLEDCMPLCELQQPDVLMSQRVDYKAGPEGPFEMLEQLQRSRRWVSSDRPASVATAAAVAAAIREAAELVPPLVRARAWQVGGGLAQGSG